MAAGLCEGVDARRGAGDGRLPHRRRIGRVAVLSAAIAFGVIEVASAQSALQALPPPVAPKIDGEVEDAEWAGSALATAFVQFEPQRGTPSSFRTEARVFVGEAFLYVAFRSWDHEPLTAQLTQRDAALNRDDSVGVLIDTFDDRQTSYFFAVNALGTQLDMRIADDGRTNDGNWDATWQSATQRTEWGWSAEFAVPFSSIKFRVSQSGRLTGLWLPMARSIPISPPLRPVRKPST